MTAALADYEAVVAHLAASCEIDYCGIGHGNYELPFLIVPPMEIAPGHGVPFAARARRAAPGLAILAEGRINRPEIGERALAEGACDLVGMTRALLVDPLVPQRARDGESDRIRPCIGYNLCVARRYRKFDVACVQNPAMGREAELGDLSPAREPRSVLIVGAGLAGLEAARVAAERGHRVTLLERDAAPGGQVRLIAGLPAQAAFAELIDWRVRELQRLGAELVLGVAADAGACASREPDAVLVATGAEPTALAGSLPAADVLAGAELADGPVVVLDLEGHRKGGGVAETLALAGRDVTLVALGASALAALAHSGVGPLALAAPRGGRGRARRGPPAGRDRDRLRPARAHLRRRAARPALRVPSCTPPAHAGRRPRRGAARALAPGARDRRRARPAARRGRDRGRLPGGARPLTGRLRRATRRCAARRRSGSRRRSACARTRSSSAGRASRAACARRRRPCGRDGGRARPRRAGATRPG